jgi:hypothetical protein
MMERVRKVIAEKYILFDSAFRQWIDKDFLTVHGAIAYAKVHHLIRFSIWKSDGRYSERTDLLDFVYES